MVITTEALRWALLQLGGFARAGDHGKRYRQVIYRLLLLHELGVTRGRPSSGLTSIAFKEHCRRFLLVSEGSLARQTAGNECYFIPTSCEYQIAAKTSTSTDWAIGTMWTRLDKWREKEIVSFSETPDKQRRINFCREYLAKLKSQSRGCLLPALPLAIFLLRNPQRTGIALDTVHTPKDLLELFLQQFRLAETEAIQLFDLKIGKVPCDVG